MSTPSLLGRWRQQQARPAAAAETPTLSSDAPPTSFPLASGQHRLWTLDRLSPGNPFYNYAESYRLRGPVDDQRLQRAFVQVFAAFDVLRTVFREEAEELRQVVTDGPGFSWTAHEVDAAEVEGHVLEVSRRPFDLEAGPLTRVELLRVGEEEFLLLIVQHHIITDKSSMHILSREVAVAYRAIGAGRAYAPTEAFTQYGAFALRQAARDKSAADLAYWTEKMRGAPPLLDLPTDAPRPARPSHRGRYRSRRLPTALSDRIRAACRTAGVTPYVYLLSVYAILLQRYSRQRDLVIGAPVSNRDTVDLQQAIGFFNETLLFRTAVGEGDTFATLLARVRDTVFEAFSHKQLPFEALVKALRPERLPGVNPLFQTMFILHQFPEPVELEGGVRLEREDVDVRVNKFDLTLFVGDDGRDFNLIFEYATDLFGADRIDRMLGQYSFLLEQLTGRADLPLADLELVSPAAFAERNETVAGPDYREPVHETILRHAARRPGATAVASEDRALTYGELDQRSAALAAALQAAGLRAGDYVALCLPRDADVAVGILGVLRAGGAYVPVDVDYPAARRDFMLRDSGARWAVTPARSGGHDWPEGVTVLPLPAPGTEAAPVPTGGEAPVGPEQPAYLIYTSGSTGQPKGVPVSHRNLALSTAARHDVYGRPPEAFLLLSSFSFDSSVAGIFWTLCGGGKLVVAPARVEQDTDRLARLVRTQRITHTLLLPRLYQQVLEYAPAEQLRSLQAVAVAGEACSAEVVRAHVHHLPDAALYNEYGPTEATVWATVHRITPSDAGGTVPIGRAVPGYRTYLTDGAGRLVPPGVAGELCIAGAGLTAGYLDRPELTAARFTTLELPDGTAERVYRTGDLVQERADGTLLFLGRTDRQVKIRGFRVEPDEIAKRLLARPGVREAEVLVTDNQLVAYVATDTLGDTAELLKPLRAELPAYMVPARVVRLTELPKLPNGKVDGTALRNLAPAAAADTAADREPPADATERQLLEIWREVLPVDDFGVADNFFTLGGDSILSIQVLARARRAGLEFPPTALFDRQTVRELATVARTAGGGGAAGAPAYSGPVALTPIQHWFFEEHQTAPHHWNHAWRFDLPDGVDAGVLEDTIEGITRRHDGLRQYFIHDGERWEAGIRGYVPGQAFVRGSGDPHDHLTALQATLDLGRDPLFRAVYFAGGGSTPATLYLFAHHLVIDMVSWQTLLQEVARAVTDGQYRPEGHGDAYHRWPEQLSEWARRDTFAGELDWWRAQEETPLPGVSAKLPVRQSAVKTRLLHLGTGRTAQLLREANRAYGTRPEELLLAATLRAVARFTGTPRHCLNLERHGREPRGSGLAVQETPGWFTTSFPLTLTDAESPGETLLGVKESLRAVPDNGIGYGVLRYLNGHGGLQQSPHIYFNYLGQQTTTAPGGGALGAGHFLHDGLRHPDGEVNRVWEVNAAVAGDRLEVAWSYSRDLHAAADVDRLLGFLEESLHELIDHCVAREDITLSPADFPACGLSRPELQRLLTDVPDPEAIYPLQHLQRALLFHHLAHPEADQGLVQTRWQLRGSLDQAAFVAAWRDTVARHPALRASVHWKNLDQPAWVVRRRADVDVRYDDWSDRPAGEREAAFAELLGADRREGLRLDGPHAHRLWVIRFGQEEHRVCWTSHHLLLDGWSAGVVLRDLLAAYGGGDPRPTAAGPAAYLRHLRYQDATARADYWRDRLARLDAPSLLPEGEGETRQVSGSLSDGERDAFVAFCRRERVTQNAVLQGLWGRLLQRCLGQETVCFGITANGRPAELTGMEDAVGMFARILPVVVPPPAEASFAALQAEAARATEQQYIDLDEVAEWTPDRYRGLPFNTLLAVQNYPWDALAGGDLTVAGVEGDITSRFPVTAVVLPRDEWEVSIRYRAGVPEALVDWLHAGFLQLIRAVGVGQAHTADVLPDPPRTATTAVADATERPAYAPPVTALQHRLVGIWETLLPVTHVGIDDNFFHCGGTSLAALRMVARLETLSGHRLPPATLLRHATVRALAGVLEGDAPLEAWNNLVPQRVSGTKAPVFCFHGGLGHVLMYEPLTRYLDPDRPVYALQPNGIDGRSELDGSIEEMARHYLEEIDRTGAADPLIMVAYCYSGAICTEIGRQLVAAGRPAPILIGADVDPPGITEAKNVTWRRPGSPAWYWGHLRLRRWREVGDQLALDWLPRGLVGEERGLRLRERRLKQGLVRAFRQYGWPTYGQAVLLIRSASLRNWKTLPYVMETWRRHTDGRLEVADVEGGHEEIFREPAVQDTARLIEEYIARCTET